MKQNIRVLHEGEIRELREGEALILNDIDGVKVQLIPEDSNRLKVLLEAPELGGVIPLYLEVDSESNAQFPWKIESLRDLIWKIRTEISGTL